MNDRQKQLLEHLIKWSKTPLSRKQIQENLQHLYVSDGSNSPYNDVAFSLITKDIQAINDDLECDYFVISKPSGIKVATINDYQEGLLKERRNILRRLIRLHTKMKKAKNNDTMRFNFEDNILEEVKSLLGEQI